MVQKYTTDRRKIAVVLLAAAVIVAVGGISSYMAKYAHKQTGEQNATSEEFYFTSDLLTSDGKKTYDLPVGTTSITFELRNYADDLRSTNDTIAYTYTVTDETGSKVADGTGSIASGDKKSSSIAISNLSAGTYTVTAASTSPYAQTLSAKFTIAPENTELNTKVEDSSGSPYAVLTVSTQEYEGAVTVSWPAGVIPDQTQDDFKGVSGSDGGSITKKGVGKYSSYTFRFFKKDASKIYTKTDITASK